MKKLTAENVYQTFISCLFKDGESTDNAILVSGISRKIGFHPDRLLTVKDEVKGYLSQLPKEFGEEYGGWSFLNGCVNANEELWGEHENAEQLFQVMKKHLDGNTCSDKDIMDSQELIRKNYSLESWTKTIIKQYQLD